MRRTVTTRWRRRWKISPGRCRASSTSKPTRRRMASALPSCGGRTKRRSKAGVSGRRDLLGLRREVLSRVDEAVFLEPVLLVVELPVAAAARQQLVVCAVLDDLALLEHHDLV